MALLLADNKSMTTLLPLSSASLTLVAAAKLGQLHWTDQLPLAYSGGRVVNEQGIRTIPVGSVETLINAGLVRDPRLETKPTMDGGRYVIQLTDAGKALSGLGPCSIANLSAAHLGQLHWTDQLPLAHSGGRVVNERGIRTIPVGSVERLMELGLVEDPRKSASPEIVVLRFHVGLRFQIRLTELGFLIQSVKR